MRPAGAEFGDAVPMVSISDLVRLALAWQQFAAHLDEVTKDSGERLPGLRLEPFPHFRR